MTKSATKLVVSGSALQAVQFAIAVVVAFFLTPFVIHSLGDRMYGFWTLAAAFVGYYGLMDLGLSSAVNRYIAGAAGVSPVADTAMRHDLDAMFCQAVDAYTSRRRWGWRESRTLQFTRCFWTMCKRPGAAGKGIGCGD
ncbi:MAG TPA: hypothetical protein VGW37_06805 [Terriglobia bacterium]|nr:hypothetical protein [Terriglobia bacterium]